MSENNDYKQKDTLLDNILVGIIWPITQPTHPASLSSWVFIAIFLIISLTFDNRGYGFVFSIIATILTIVLPMITATIVAQQSDDKSTAWLGGGISGFISFILTAIVMSIIMTNLRSSEK